MDKHKFYIVEEDREVYLTLEDARHMSYTQDLHLKLVREEEE